MKKRMIGHVSGSVALLALVLGCGADSVDVGDRPELIGSVDSASSPDAGSLVEGSTSCNIPNLGQYRLLFDSDGGRLERRIYSMRADGTEIEPLTPPEELAREPALSPDGRQLAYVTPEGIRLLDLASGASELLVPDADLPAWAPDGSTLIYERLGCVQALNVTDGTVSHENCGSEIGTPSFTHDGAGYVYTVRTAFTGVDFGFELAAASLRNEGGYGYLVSRSTVEIAHPTASPDGIWVAASYGCGVNDAPSIWASPFTVVTPACEGRRITPAGGPSALNPEWGPLGLIAYERGEPPRDIAIVAADTGEECVIAGLGDDRNPSWSIFPSAVPE